MSDPQIVYACQELPRPEPYEDDEDDVHIRWNSIFLAGPTPRDPGVPSWRPEAIRLLREVPFGGHVFVPEAEGGGWHGNYEEQVKWEWSALGLASKILFWIPRDLETLPGFTTNVEFGILMVRYPDRVILGCPDDAPKTRYLKMMVTHQSEFARAFKTHVEKVPVVSTLKAAIELAANSC